MGKESTKSQSGLGKVRNSSTVCYAPLTFSAEARSLIKGMLHADPNQRLSIEEILTHPWFQMTIVDQVPQGDGHSLPTTPDPSRSNSGMFEKDTFFTEPAYRGDPGPSSARFHAGHWSNQPSPLNTEMTQFIPDRVSEASETSGDPIDSDDSKNGTRSTTPTTAEDEESDQKEPVIPRVHSGEFSHTERTLELLHPNSSQSTIKRPENESKASTGSVKARVAAFPGLEGQTEVDEDAVELAETNSASVPLFDEHSLHIPIHSRTPSRTKRQSVSSLERRRSHQSTSGQWQTYAPEDYLSQLRKERPKLFSRPAEKHLLEQLSNMGFDTGQMVHSVTSDACDASAATWWILRIKQYERGETDEVVEARNRSNARKRERAAAYAREERRKARDSNKDKNSSKDVTPEVRTPEVKFAEHSTPQVRVMDLGAPIASQSLPKAIVTSPEPILVSQSLDTKLHLTGPPEPKAVTGVKQEYFDRPIIVPPQTPPKVDKHLERNENVPSPTEGSPTRDRIKSRSPSMSMLQRATSAMINVGKKTVEDKDKEKERDREKTPTAGEHAHIEGDKKTDSRSESPTKLIKPYKPKGVNPESTLLNLPKGSPASSITIKSPSGTPHRELPTYMSSLSRDRSPAATSHLSEAHSSETINKDSTAGPSTKSPSEPVEDKGSKIKWDGLWTQFRHMFNEDRRRRKRDIRGGTTSPLTYADGHVKIAPAVVLSRGPAARSPHVGRVPYPSSASSRKSLDVSRPGFSRRSSSANSRRSSVNSVVHASELHDSLSALDRRISHRSHGSQTPTSDREYASALEYPSRPSSSHSMQRGGSFGGGSSSHPGHRLSSTSLRSPSVQSDSSQHSRQKYRGQRSIHDAQKSPLHEYQRRRTSGASSTRIRHIRVIPETHVLRSTSVASSTRSNASSRASSINGDYQDRTNGESDYDNDTGNEDSSIRSGIRGGRKRRGSDERRRGSGNLASSLAQQIHRKGSPLALHNYHSASKYSSGKPKPKPLRDVFQPKEGDNEWVDEDDDTETFQGGLGQGEYTQWDANGKQGINNLGRASQFPTSTPMGKKSKKKSDQTSAQTQAKDGKTSRGDVPEGVELENVRRVGLPDRSGKPPVVMEEDEEEEE